MASLIDTLDLTLNPGEPEEASKAIFEKVYTKPDLNAAHQVITGVQMKTQIPFFGLLGAVGKKSSACTPNTSTEIINLTEKYWDPELIDFRLIHCQNEISSLFKMWKKSRIAKNTWEEVSNPQVAFIADRTIDAAMESILRISSFGDKNAALIANGGYITAGKDITFLNMINGLWQQIFAATLTRYTIPENGEATKAAQEALASDRALNVFRYLYNNIDARALKAGNAVYQVTRSLFNNWNDFLEDKSIGFSLQRVEEGWTKGSYRGYPIIVREDWDRNISEWNNQGTTLLYPHRAILSPIENIPIGTSDEGSMSDFDAFYDKVTKKHYIDVAFYIDVKLLEEYMIAVAY